MKFWRNKKIGIAATLIAVTLLDGCANSPSAAAARASDSMPAKDGATAKWMIEQEKTWAEMACGGKWVALDLFADDFQGTSPGGSRYGRPTSVPAPDPKTQWSTDCRLDSADVRFFSADVAVVFGAESKTIALPDSKHERRCLVWSDMWLRNKDRWQLIAVQDNRVTCPAA